MFEYINRANLSDSPVTICWRSWISSAVFWLMVSICPLTRSITSRVWALSFFMVSNSVSMTCILFFSRAIWSSKRPRSIGICSSSDSVSWISSSICRRLTASRCWMPSDPVEVSASMAEPSICLPCALSGQYKLTVTTLACRLEPAFIFGIEALFPNRPATVSR